MSEMLNVEAIVAEVGPAVREAILKQTTERVASSLSYSLESAIRRQVETYVEERVMKDVMERLRGSHEEMVQAICEAVGVSCNGLRDALIARVTKRLGDGYTVGEVAKKLFDGGF